MNSSDDATTDSSGATGGSLRARAQGARTDQLGAALAALDPDLLAWADGFIFKDVWTGPGISFEDRMLVAIVSLASCGQLAQLRNYLHGALQDGIDPVRIQEALKMLVVYIGFPAALSALVVYQDVRAKDGSNQ